jgi:hypothetical protein
MFFKWWKGWSNYRIVLLHSKTINDSVVYIFVRLKMNSQIFQDSAFLKAIYYSKPTERKRMLELMGDEETRVFCEIALKILHRRIIINLKHEEKLKDYKNIIRSLSSHRISLTRKKRTLLTFHILIPLLIKTHSTSVSWIRDSNDLLVFLIHCSKHSWM